MDVPCEMHLHPELLTNEQLKYIIQQRHLKIDNMENMSRDSLLEVFHQFCVPYGQRRYRDSGRGKILNKSRRMSPERMPTLNTLCNTHCKRTLYNNDRIKTSPDYITGHIKRIRLESNSVAVNNVDHSKRKMSVDPSSEAADSPPNKKERKLITWP